MKIFNTNGEMLVGDEALATRELDNLNGTAINATLTPDTDSTYSFGSTLKKWISGFFDTIILGEQVSAPADVAGDGQIWVKDDVPNTLWYTDDAGTDIRLGVDSTTVDGAGATMNTDADVSANSWVIDEDAMTSDSALRVPTQQSVKAYVDAVQSSGISSQFMLSARGGTPSTTAGCAAATQVEFTTNDIDLWSCAFDSATQEYIQWNHPLPADYGGGTVTAKFYWYATDASTNGVVWYLGGGALADGDAIDSSLGTEQGVIDANNADSDLNITAATVSITMAGTPTAGEMVMWRAFRNVSHGNDDLAVDAHLLWISITYTRA